MSFSAQFDAAVIIGCKGTPYTGRLQRTVGALCMRSAHGRRRRLRVIRGLALQELVFADVLALHVRQSVAQLALRRRQQAQHEEQA